MAEENKDSLSFKFDINALTSEVLSQNVGTLARLDTLIYAQARILAVLENRPLEHVTKDLSQQTDDNITFYIERLKAKHNLS